MSSLNPRNPKNQNQWRFTYETQADIPTLRLYVFNPDTNPSIRCLGIRSNLQLSRSLLVVSWSDSEKSEEVSIRVPIPRVLIDPDSNVEVRGRGDHIEIKMRLVLPVDHPVAVNLRGVLGPDGDLDGIGPIAMDSDLKYLSSGDVNLFCKACSTRLTKHPLRRFMEMPSVDWREVADNWFGACCCSFGGISEKLVLQYIKTYDCAEGTCLLDSAAVIICKDDLEGYAFQQQKLEIEANGKVADAAKESCKNAGEDILAISACIDQTLDHGPESSKCEKHTNSLACSPTSRGDCNGIFNGHDLLLTESSCLGQLILSETQSTGHCHYCPDEASYEVISGPEKIHKWLHDCSLGSGFVSRNSNVSNKVEWIEFVCRNCSSVLGAYPSYKTKNVPVDGGVRLFKCYLSTSNLVGGPDDIFRKYTLERVFVSLLLEGAKDELSYRIVLKDLRSKSPMLQIVLLNSESWCSTGYCSEDATMEEAHAEANLQPVVKVLFSDCRVATEASSRILKEWGSETHMEEVYMMRHEIEELTKRLKSSAMRLPETCRYFQGMCLSAMER